MITLTAFRVSATGRDTEFLRSTEPEGLSTESVALDLVAATRNPLMAIASADP
jgi:hypothetical protein